VHISDGTRPLYRNWVIPKSPRAPRRSPEKAEGNEREMLLDADREGSGERLCQRHRRRHTRRAGAGRSTSIFIDSNGVEFQAVLQKLGVREQYTRFRAPRCHRGLPALTPAAWFEEYARTFYSRTRSPSAFHQAQAVEPGSPTSCWYWTRAGQWSLAAASRRTSTARSCA